MSVHCKLSSHCLLNTRSAAKLTRAYQNGRLPSGFPRQAGTWVDIGGVRSSFSMPEVFSVALGGGTKIEEGTDGTVYVGPESVGHRLTTEGLVFGGNTLTTTG